VAAAEGAQPVLELDFLSPGDVWDVVKVRACRILLFMGGVFIKRWYRGLMIRAIGQS